MESRELTFSLAYIVFSFCFVVPPNEFRCAGLTIQSLFSSWLGSEDIGFTQYHIRRTSLTVLVHSALPLGYYIGMCVAAPEKDLGYMHQACSPVVMATAQSDAINDSNPKEVDQVSGFPQSTPPKSRVGTEYLKLFLTSPAQTVPATKLLTSRAYLALPLTWK